MTVLFLPRIPIYTSTLKVSFQLNYLARGLTNKNKSKHWYLPYEHLTVLNLFHANGPYCSSILLDHIVCAKFLYNMSQLIAKLWSCHNELHQKFDREVKDRSYAQIWPHVLVNRGCSLFIGAFVFLEVRVALVWFFFSFYGFLRLVAVCCCNFFLFNTIHLFHTIIALQKSEETKCHLFRYIFREYRKSI